MTLQVEHSQSTETSDLEDLLLQTVDTERSFGEVQAHAAVPNAVHHVQVGLGAAPTDGHWDAEDVDIATAALRLRRDTQGTGGRK